MLEGGAEWVVRTECVVAHAPSTNTSLRSSLMSGKRSAAAFHALSTLSTVLPESLPMALRHSVSESLLMCLAKPAILARPVLPRTKGRRDHDTIMASSASLRSRGALAGKVTGTGALMRCDTTMLR
jgi:hypothetical protein